MSVRVRWLLAIWVLVGVRTLSAAQAVQPSSPIQAGTVQPAADEPPPAATPDSSSEQSSVSLSRTGADGKQRQITVVRTGNSDDTGIFAICTPREGDPPNTPTIFVTSESAASGIELRVDKNIIRAPLAVITKQAAKQGAQQGDGHIEVSAGKATYLDTVPDGKTDRLSLCAVAVKPLEVAGAVSVTQGRTHLSGQSLVYDESDGLVRIKGPITFERNTFERGTATGSKEALSGTSQSIEVDIDHETTTLVGDVALRSGTRVSKAARVEYDDQANIAILYGTPQQPAEVIDGGDVIRAQRIRTNLDTGRVSAEGISGTFEVSGLEDGSGH